MKKNFKNKYLIHTLAIYYPGKQRYGKKYFTDLKGILKFFNLEYLEYGEKWTKEEGRTFFLAKFNNLKNNNLIITCKRPVPI